MRSPHLRRAVVGALTVLATIAAYIATQRHTLASSPPPLSYAELTGSSFVNAPDEPFRAPAVKQITVPDIDDANGIWGATGRDARGHIWVGVSAKTPGMSAHLFEYDPAGGSWRDHGAVVDQLKAAGLLRAGEGQVKIHSKIVPAADGWLYFASMDEEGEKADGSALPRWGGHLWRIHPERGTWEHLLAAPQGLVAVSGVGRYMYALGYWGHVLYQYDTANGKANSVAVGSVGGHISRNFLADGRGHVFVPRLTAADAGAQGGVPPTTAAPGEISAGSPAARAAQRASKPAGQPSVVLVEYDPQLREIATTPLEHYLEPSRSAGSNHGIVGLAYLPSGDMVFTTHAGYLYRITATGDGPATVRGVDWMNSTGSAYVPSLFSFGGDTWLAGVAYQKGPQPFAWVVRDLTTGVVAAFPLDTRPLQDVLLYGSISRDNAGRLYVVGWAANSNGNPRPLMLQLDPRHSRPPATGAQ